MKTSESNLATTIRWHERQAERYARYAQQYAGTRIGDTAQLHAAHHADEAAKYRRQQAQERSDDDYETEQG